MAYKVKLLPEVYQDLKAAQKWYNDQKAGLGAEFKAAVIKEIDYIGEYPEHYQRKYIELRQSLVDRFPFAVFYLIEEEHKRIVILGVLHTSRDPETVKRRKK